MEVAQDEEEEAESAQKRATRATASPRSTSTQPEGAGGAVAPTKPGEGARCPSEGQPPYWNTGQTELCWSCPCMLPHMFWAGSQKVIFLSVVSEGRKAFCLKYLVPSITVQCERFGWKEVHLKRHVLGVGWGFEKHKLLFVWGKRCLKDFWQEKGLFWKGCPDRLQKGWF